MKGMSRALRFGKSVADNGWRMFTTFLEYKSQEQGKQLLKIDKWFPSTKMCSRCRNKKEMPLCERMYACSCGLTIGRDYNAPINIKRSHTLTSVGINSNKITFGTRELARLS